MMAPWTQENPIFMHVRRSDEASVKAAIDQCAAVGFEMVIMTFGSGFNIENNSPEYMEMMKRLNAYAHSKGIALGGYSLLASRGAKTEDAAISRNLLQHGKREAALENLLVLLLHGEILTLASYAHSLRRRVWGYLRMTVLIPEILVLRHNTNIIAAIWIPNGSNGR